MSQVRKGRIDPIELLREYIMQKKPIRLRKDKKGVWFLQFDSVELKCQMESAWKSPKIQREYSLGSLWWFLEAKQKKLDNKEYRSRTIELNIDAVMIADQQEIEDYFTGKIDYTECINAEKKSQLYKGKQDQLELSLTKKIKSSEEEPTPLEFNLRAIEEMLRFEKPITTKNRQFRCFDRNFDNVLQISKKVLYGQGSKNEIQANEENPIAFNGSLLQEILLMKQKPIIIVPQIFEMGNLCLKNVSKFLEEGEYSDPTTEKFTLETRSVCITQTLKYLKQNITFEVRDAPNTFDAKTWKRVVAIFVRGSAYELKSLQGAKDTVQFFKRYRGYHVKFEDDQPKDTIKQWNVKVLELHRNKRHYDQSVVNQFWEDLENFVLKPSYKEKQQ